jgi:hypothetical protein
LTKRFATTALRRLDAELARQAAAG